jgi:hypothetical protein
VDLVLKRAVAVVKVAVKAVGVPVETVGRDRAVIGAKVAGVLVGTAAAIADRARLSR